jgi:hypothetical protein
MVAGGQRPGRPEAGSAEPGSGLSRPGVEGRRVASVARARSAWAEERVNRQNEERYRAWGRGGGSIGPDVGGGDEEAGSSLN